MSKGSYSDYVALHIQGAVDLWPEAPLDDADESQSCWTAPAVHHSWLGKIFDRFISLGRIENTLPTGPVSQTHSRDGPTIFPGGKITLLPDRDFARRVMGVATVLWKQPRNVTLTADDKDGKACQIVLIKRKLFVDCLQYEDPRTKLPSPLYKSKIEDFLKESLPGLLERNRLFRPLFYTEEVENWQQLARALTLNPSSDTKVARVRERLSQPTRKWLGELKDSDLSDDEKYRLVSTLNDLLDPKEGLFDKAIWPKDSLHPRAKEHTRQKASKDPNRRRAIC